MGHRSTRNVAVVEFENSVPLLPALYKDCLPLVSHAARFSEESKESNETLLLQSTLAELINQVKKVSTGKRMILQEAADMSEMEIIFWQLSASSTGQYLLLYSTYVALPTCWSSNMYLGDLCKSLFNSNYIVPHSMRGSMMLPFVTLNDIHFWYNLPLNQIAIM
jgi:hypothetical protein